MFPLHLLCATHPPKAQYGSLEPPWQVWKIESWPLGQLDHKNCDSCTSLAYGELREKNGQHFVILPTAKCLEKTPREKRTALCPVFTPTNYSCLSLSCGTLAGHSTAPRPFRQLKCSSAPPPDFVYGVWGQALFSFVPPLDPFGIYRVHGLKRWRQLLHWFSGRYGRNAHQKYNLVLSISDVHSICVTVRLLPFPACALQGCGRKGGGPGRLSNAFSRGVLRDAVPGPKIQGNLRQL